MSLIKKARQEIAESIGEQNLPSEVVQLILEGFISQIQLGTLNNEIRNLQAVVKDLQEKIENTGEEMENDINESDDDE